ncbi:zf-HC2 domain-containing protein [Pyxidicoccus parkwayensis]|uniref:Zf-HC2 domain-containing protein n=1 Tax=Pyxidicoccus parkwayensis TaxID=2813578 RepID=A0ABX7P3L0_9BACT|nr:zf-HC2 domain-containing protein [Pyxidicoccus parkwaysis]QSQ25041.1 zf-HC2 domain-containing protein [Pyxidicoccus parkwaysis]
MNPQNAHAHEDRLLDFAYGELPVPEARAMEAHLSGCARCTQALDDIRGVRATMSHLSAEEPAPDAGLESLLAYAQQAARRAAAGPEPKPSRWRRWLLPVVGLASVATFGILAIQARDPALTQLDVGKMARAESASKAAPAAVAPEPLADNAAPAPVVANAAPAPAAQAAPAETEAVLDKVDKAAAKEVDRADDWASAGSGGALDARIVRKDEMQMKRERAKASYEKPRASSAQPLPSKVAPSKFAPEAKAALEEKTAPDEERPAELVARDALSGADALKQDGLRIGGAARGKGAVTGSTTSVNDDATYGEGVAAEEAQDFDTALAQTKPTASAAPAPTTAAAPPPPPVMAPASPPAGGAAVVTGAVARAEPVAERRAPAQEQAPAKKAKRAENELASAGPKDEAPPSVKELSRRAQEAYSAGERAQEAALLRSALATGVSGAERLDLLNRLCGAELALNRPGSGCKKLMDEDPNSSIAQVARRRLQSGASGVQAAPKSADPSK